MSPTVISSEKIVPFRMSCVSNLSNPNGLGALEKLPEAVIRKIFEEFLSLQEKAYFLQVCSFSKIVLQGSWENVQKQYLLPVEAFGNLEMCEKILPMPQKLLEVLNGEDGHLYVPVLKASRFRHVMDGKQKVFSATYRGIEKVSKLRNGLGYHYIWRWMISVEDPCEVEKMRWVLMTKDVLLNSRSTTYKTQVTFVKNWISENFSLREGFEILKNPRDAVYVLFYQFCQDQTRLYSDHPSTYMRCQNLVGDGVRVGVGNFGLSGLRVRSLLGNPFGNIGVGVLRKF